jgi:hypothetical protein
MKATVVGFKKTDFQGDRGPVKTVKYFLVIDSGDDGLVGKETNELSWNEIENGNAPSITVGQEIEVNYNRRGRPILDMNSISKK